MIFTPSTTVREIAKNIPASVRIFEELGIEYCCSGAQSIAQACEKAQHTFEEVLTKLQESSERPEDVQLTKLGEASLSELTRHIVERHHSYVRNEISRLEPLLEKAGAKHAESYPELIAIKLVFGFLAEEMLDHMTKEEQVLFPYIEQLEVAKNSATLPPQPFFGSVARPVECMMKEHDRAGGLVKHIRELSHNYIPPENACATLRALYNGLREFEQDLHQHVHLENNILFPEAVELEAAACALA
jgi:regulator of cell morphogenesis and NO signaling